MTKAELQEQVLKLSVEERLELAEALWESVEWDAEAVPVHEWQRELLDERLESAKRDPDGWLGWDGVARSVKS